MEQFTPADHERLANNWEQYLKTGEAPTAGLRALFRRIADALKRFVMSDELSPKLRKFFDQMLAGPDGELLAGRLQELTGETQTHARVETDNKQQQAFAEMNEAERILQSDMYSQEEKAQAGKILFQINEKDKKHAPTAALIERAMSIPDAAEREKVIKNIRELRKQYAGTAAEFKAPNGKESLLLNELGEEKGQQAWYAVRTENFKKWFGDWESIAEIAELESNLQNYIAILEKVKEGTRKELFEKYGNELKPIAFIPQEYLKYFKGTTSDNRIYTGLGYFIDHAVNRHSDVQLSDYKNIQDIINNPDEIIIDRREDQRTKQEKDNLLFVKKYEKNTLLVIRLETNNDGQILLHKSLYHNKNTPYPGLPRIQGLSYGDGVTPIGRVEQTTPGGSLSARYDNIKIRNYIQNVNPNSVSKVVDVNSEPLPVFHGTKAQFHTFDLTKARQNADVPAFFFSNDRTDAAGYGDVNAYFLDIRNPKPDLPIVNMRGSEIREELISQGFDGIVTSEDEYTEYAAFYPNQMKSATDNVGAYSTENNNILFQMSREDIYAEAMRYESWQDWMRAEVFAETQGWDRAFRLDDVTLEPKSQQEIEAWYEKQWNEAQVLAREAELGASDVQTPANAESVEPELQDETYTLEDEGSLDFDPELYEAEAADNLKNNIEPETEIVNASNTMSGILETGESAIVTHEKFGNITIDAGEAVKKSF